MKIRELKQKLKKLLKDTEVVVAYKNLKSSHVLDIDNIHQASTFKAVFLTTKETNETKNTISLQKNKKKI